MSKVIIPAWQSFMYSEVWKVLQRKDGCIYKTEKTGLYVHNDDANKLSEDYITSSVSTKLTEKGGDISLELFSLE
jgi:tRNA pseudouridine-54 N-methylase